MNLHRCYDINIYIILKFNYIVLKILIITSELKFVLKTVLSETV